MVLGLFSNRPRNKKRVTRPHNGRDQDSYVPAEAITLADDPLEKSMQQERFRWILAQRNRWRDHPRIASVCREAEKRLDELYALVPEGQASLPQTVNDYPGCPEVDVETGLFLLARHTVTNAQFQRFVDAGGYEDLSLWDKDIWPHLIDFKDLTECPAPRYWEHGRHDQRLGDHPVVGVCYFEAVAYTRWAGVRLATEAEWQMAASWRIRSCAQVLRRYPWGDALDIKRCNVWASNIGHTVAVGAYENGSAPNGVQQLVGNVWEWTEGDFSVIDANNRPVVGDMLLKSIRGGAFDTYFPSQATSLFRTGLGVLFRVHNVGFRCAMDIDNGNALNN